MSDFLPSNYAEPTGGGRYTKIKEGETVKLRVISATITEGFQRWTDDNKPIRWRKSEGEPKRSDWKQEGKAKYFWVLVVYNYNSGQIEVWEITQSSIRESIASLVKAEEYGHPKGYDIKVSRSGTGLDTTYSVVPLPPKDLVQDILVKITTELLPNLDALFTGDDPFA